MFAQHENALPKFSDAVSIEGVPVPPSLTRSQPLDLNQLLIRHPSGTYFVRVSGDAMRDAGILDGDILVVDRTLSAFNGAIVIAAVNQDFIIRYFSLNEGVAALHSAHPNYPEIPFTHADSFEIWGIVTAVVRQVISV